MVEEKKDIDINEVVDKATELPNETTNTEKKVETPTQVEEKPVVEEEKKEVTTNFTAFEERITALETNFDEKVKGLESKHAETLSEKDTKIKELEDRLAELERTAPNLGVNPVVTQETTKTPQDLRRESVVGSWFNQPKK